MSEKHRIKVIKKGEVAPAPAAAPSESKAKRAAARKMVTTVTNWVSDLQTRKREETKLAIEQLFGAQPRPNES